ncbi:MAG: hypothetical protein KTR18_08500, partial [Acidiferrobacterales bacterium]|nr:hypothetical protein [Acidiferrobacterales bacterium]
MNAPIDKSVNKTLPIRVSSPLHQGIETDRYRHRWLRALLEPVPASKKELLNKAWQRLPKSLQQPNQIIGQHWSQCGYTMGPSFCSFGCSHCYLPKAANK